LVQLISDAAFLLWFIFYLCSAFRFNLCMVSGLARVFAWRVGSATAGGGFYWRGRLGGST